MGCCGGRERIREVTDDQKWHNLNLSDFRSRSCFTPFSYLWLWILAFSACAVYGVDTFTAVNLLAFNRWSSQVEPVIPFEISKWIFAGCIIFSWVLCFIEWIHAIKTIRSGNISDSYLDPLAAVILSIRPGKYQGWKRFLVFAELTKSRKGMDYICLYVYFTFKTTIRVILAEGPRQVVNGVTLYSVVRLNLVPVGENAATEDRTAIAQFFKNLEVLADTDRLQAVILSAMAFTFVIWVISALSLLIAFILYILIVWHHVPSSDGSLSNYCRRKADTRLDRIISKTTKKAIEKQEVKRRREEEKAVKKGEPRPGQLSRQPTLPQLSSDDSDFGRPPSPALSRADTVSTFHTSSASEKQPNLPNIQPRPSGPSRTFTQSSVSSYGSTAPLLSQAGRMEQDVPPMPSMNRNESYGRPPMSRTTTGNSSRSYATANQSNMRPPMPGAAGYGYGRNSPAQSTNSNYSTYNPGRANPNQRNLAPNPSESSFRSYDNSMNNGRDQNYEMNPVVTPVSAARRPTYVSQDPSEGGYGRHRAQTPYHRAQTATPGSMQRRDVSSPLPNNGSFNRPEQMRSVTDPAPYRPYNGPPRPVASTPYPGNRPGGGPPRGAAQTPYPRNPPGAGPPGQSGQSNWSSEQGW